MYSNLGKYP